MPEAVPIPAMSQRIPLVGLSKVQDPNSGYEEAMLRL